MIFQLKQKALQEIAQAKDLKSLEEVHRKFLGRQGQLTAVFKSLKDLSDKKRKEQGHLANQTKQELERKFEETKKKLHVTRYTFQEDWIDVTAPGQLPEQGRIHPISQLRKQIEEIFQAMGFTVAQGPEIETAYYNFDALNIPAEHPARDRWDTLWLKTKELLLRTHTSPVQIHYMETHHPPLRIISPGRCFRYEATDATHDIQFHQIEGLMIDKNISVAHFKGVLQEFLRRFLGPDVQIRLRHSYFPFTEPSFEIDIKREKGDWIELMGAGMVHPNVFKAVKYNPQLWQGFAFGLGLERLAMMKYRIDDIRLFNSGDLRFLKQF